MKVLNYLDKLQFEVALKKLEARQSFVPDRVKKDVAKIIRKVQLQKDKALFDYTAKFDNAIYNKKTVKVDRSELKKAYNRLPRNLTLALELIAKRIEKFHIKQLESSYEIKEGRSSLKMSLTPLSAVGIYAPGGKAAYPSSVLMSAIPAKIAKVEKVILTTPTPNGVPNDLVLAAAWIAKVDEVYKVGGSQAIAALTFATESIPKVDKIVGPGNIYVAEAKRQLYGIIDIDMIAGPSEILILADNLADPKLIGYDLLAQAEHDEMAYPILVTTSKRIATQTQIELSKALLTLQRKSIAKASIKNNGLILLVKDIEMGIKIVNRVAPEHFELHVKNSDRYISKIKNVGAFFIGEYSPEAIGDYSAGVNHILPTGATSRFGSPLGVYDFIKRTSIVNLAKPEFDKLSAATIDIANAEGFTAHALAVKVRINKFENES
ncbi:MAG: histidinol dehydrogenase [Nitrospinota bacterium]